MTWEDLVHLLSDENYMGSFHNPMIEAYGGLDKLQSLYDQYNNLGQSGDYLSWQGALANSGIELSPEMEKWLDNMISLQNTKQGQDFSSNQRDTSLLSTADQLSQLGLSTANVSQIGGMSTPGVVAAQSSKENVAMQKAQMKNQMAQSLVRSLSMLGSAGIHGSTMAMMKKATNRTGRSLASNVLDMF